MNEAMDILDFVFGEKETGVSVFLNSDLGLQMRTILNDDQSISVNAEDAARGFGWTTVAKSGNEVIRWGRMNSYCKEFGFSPEVGKDDYIPESLFYMLAMKANNERAKKFQMWIAMDVIPSIRKTGGYSPKEQKRLFSEDSFRMIELINQASDDRMPFVKAVLEREGVVIHDVPPRKSRTAERHSPVNYPDSDTVEHFLHDADVSGRPTGEVYEEYSEYCARCAVSPVSKICFSKIVNRILGTRVIQRKISGRNHKVFVY